MKLTVVFCALCCAGALLAQTQQDPSYSGTWFSHDKNVKLVLDQTADKIHVQEYRGSTLKSEYTCGITGKVCKFKDGGHAATVSLWINGPKLVALETRGDTVTKRRFTLDDKGSKLDEEVLPISPPGATQTIAYSRD
jgi:hypothetical protein